MVRGVFFVGTVNNMLVLTDPEWSLSLLHAASSNAALVNLSAMFCKSTNPPIS